jgi:hypothetical protein
MDPGPAGQRGLVFWVSQPERGIDSRPVVPLELQPLMRELLDTVPPAPDVTRHEVSARGGARAPHKQAPIDAAKPRLPLLPLAEPIDGEAARQAAGEAGKPVKPVKQAKPVKSAKKATPAIDDAAARAARIDAVAATLAAELAEAESRTAARAEAERLAAERTRLEISALEAAQAEREMSLLAAGEAELPKPVSSIAEARAAQRTTGRHAVVPSSPSHGEGTGSNPAIPSVPRREPTTGQSDSATPLDLARVSRRAEVPSTRLPAPVPPLRDAPPAAPASTPPPLGTSLAGAARTLREVTASKPVLRTPPPPPPPRAEAAAMPGPIAPSTPPADDEDELRPDPTRVLSSLRRGVEQARPGRPPLGPVGFGRDPSRPAHASVPPAPSLAALPSPGPATMPPAPALPAPPALPGLPSRLALTATAPSLRPVQRATPVALVPARPALPRVPGQVRGTPPLPPATPTGPTPTLPRIPSTGPTIRRGAAAAPTVQIRPSGSGMAIRRAEDTRAAAQRASRMPTAQPASATVDLGTMKAVDIVMRDLDLSEGILEIVNETVVVLRPGIDVQHWLRRCAARTRGIPG